MGSEPIIIFDIEKQSVISSLEGGGRGQVSDFHYSPDGRWLAAQYFFWNFQVWDVENERVQIQRLSDVLTGENTPGSIFSFAFSSDCNMIAVGGENTIEIWDVNATKQLFVLYVAQELHAVWEVSFSSDGNRLYALLNTGEKRIAEVWDLIERKLLNRFDLPEAMGGRVLNGPYYARDNKDENNSWVEVWNLETAEIEYKLMSFSLEDCYQNGNFIFGWGDENLYVWDATTGKLVSEI